MKKLFFKKHSFLFVALAFLLIGLLFEYSGNNIIARIRCFKEAHHIQYEVSQKEIFIQKLFNNLEKKSLDYIYCNFDGFLQLAEKNNILIYIYEKERLVLWSDNHITPTQLTSIDNVPVLQRLPNGYYLQVNRKLFFYSLVALIPVESAYPLQNKYLKNEFLLTNTNSGFRLYEQEYNVAEKFYISSKSGMNLFALTDTSKDRGNHLILLLYLFGIILIFFYIDKQFFESFYANKNLNVFLIFTASLLIIILFWRIFRIPRIFFSQILFSPEIYASSYLFRSLGDLLLSVLLLTWILRILIKTVRPNIGKKKINHILLAVSGLLITLLFSFFLSKLIRGLVLNSNISFDISDFYKFNKYGLIAYLILFLLFYNFIRLTYYIFSIIDKHLLTWIEWLAIFFIPGAVYFIFFLYYTETNIIILFYSICVWLLYLFTDPVHKLNLNTILIYILITAAFNANMILEANSQKEFESRKHLITTVATDKDPIAEELLSDVVNRITQDNYVKSYYTNPIVTQNLLKRRLKQLYFSGYLSQYDFNLYSFTNTGTQYKIHSSIDTIQYFFTLLHESQRVDTNGNIYFINNYDGAPGYIIYFPVKDNNELIGQLIMVLKQKPFIIESFYPELLIEGGLSKNDLLKNYSYAIYKNNYLTNQKGTYPYPLTYSFDETKGSSYYNIHEKKYDHLVYKLTNQVLIIMSRETNTLFNSLALFSILFVLSTLILAIIFYLKHVYFNLKLNKKFEFKTLNPFSNLSFKFKIQLASLLTVLLALVLTGYVTIIFLKFNSNQNAKTRLGEEIITITENMDSYFKENSLYKKDIYTRVKTIADQFKTDINLFDIDGNLITSSQMSLYERKIISNKMDAVAYDKLKIQQNSQLIQNENIGGTITYLSAYGMVRDASNNVIAFINIPYFSKEREMNQEISSLIVTTINLYVFLFLLITLISVVISNTVTVPLETIRNNLAEVQLGRLNKKIEWKSTDEIGQLVEEYNKMLEKVEESAEVLARSEREIAWREMAKQVAHEIKNPLTPMKLNIQQLMRAWNDKVSNLDEIFNKITHILINRIDTLSEIATEFSRFARMPEPINTKFILENVIRETVHLFSESENSEIKLKLKTNETYIWADENQISRAFNNLLKNALQSIPVQRKGLINIETDSFEGNIIVMIKDNGIGIAEDIMDKIFLPNFSTKSSGMGLGLAIVSRIITHANGKIWFETHEDIGTTFFISFPALNNDMGQPITGQG